MGLLHRGDVIEGRYSVLRKLGEGQFAEVWEVVLCEADTDALDLRYALKLEKSKERHVLRQEYKILKRLSGACSQVVGVEGTGVHNERLYVVMGLLGDTLYDARKAAGGVLDGPTLRSVALSTLSAIRQLHEAGFVHRDIKPANLAVSPPHASAATGVWTLIDFGLARRYTDEAGAHLPPRCDAAFRGSTSYASVHAHRRLDLGRRDDLWSWFYMLVECADGCLPWRPERDGSEHVPADKAWVQQQKEACMEAPQQLTRNGPLPEPLLAVAAHLASLDFADAPDYALLASTLSQLPDTQGQAQQQQLAAAAAAANGTPSYPQQVSAGLTPTSPGGLTQQYAASPYDGGSVVGPGAKRARLASGSSADLLQQQQQQAAGDLQQQAAAANGADGSAGQRGQRQQGAASSSKLRPGSSSEQQQQQAAKRSGGAAGGAGPKRTPGAGSAAEISELLAAFERSPERSRAPAQAVIDSLCALPPLDAVCAIGVTLDRLVTQSRASCLPEVSQLLLDLAAFASQGAAAARKAAAATSRQQQQQTARRPASASTASVGAVELQQPAGS